ncbi:MAG TPA: phenylalanine--tRNA ligase subunit beta [Tepidisphaeraceae bacterium]|jgi:phenylalanyl-tRNA synthetase beta chain|nr:phenylalanine--tRNA ligase subunit beta [Tepidisphaeraceae bacterium]
MKTSLEWLRDSLPSPLTPEVAGEALTHGGLPVENIERHGDDSVIDVEVTSNRGDCLSHLGVARELSALLNREFRDLTPNAKESAPPTASAVSVGIEASDLCPHYSARLIRGVKVGPSPAWMARRLEAIGVRPISNIVDVTNYVLFEMGQPLHAFDFRKIEGGRIIIRRARRGERIISLDGKERVLADDMLVIADAVRPVAIAGVMGGHDSEVSADTTDVLIESARFDPLSVRKTSRALDLRSDSSYRFERGIDPLLPERASLRAAQLILEMAGGELLSGLVEAGATGYRPKVLALRLARLKQILGVEFPPDVVVDALARLRLQPVLRNDQVECTIPSYRLDLNIEVDLVEEVARVVGYDKVPVRDAISIRVTPPNPAADAMETVRQTLISGGFFEAITFTFVSDLLAHDFTPAGAHAAAPLLRAQHTVRKADAHLRPSILPGLLESVRHNETAAGIEPRLFEIGSTFWRDAAGSPVERRRLAIVGGNDLREVRGAVESLLRRLDAGRSVAVVPDSRAGFAAAASGRVEWGGVAIGHLGRIDRAVAGKLSLREIPAAAELDLEPLLAGMQHVPQLRPLPKFPAVRRDLSLVVPEPTRYEKIESLIRGAQPRDMEDLQYVTTYRGKPLEKGSKSVTVTLVFRSPTETLTGEQVDASVQRVMEAVTREGWQQRV